jgi:alpha-amylase/alpha-mannosidase (GH57 family)
MMYLSILWHMHQPYYVNVNTGQINTPTLIFRTLFNYYPMAVLVEKNPGVKINFNLTPVLLKQIDGISSGQFTDRFLNLIDGKSETTPEELLRFAAELPAQIFKGRKIVGLLKEKIEKNSYSKQDISDLKVYLHLLCFHPMVFDEEIEHMLKKGRCFDEKDRELLYRKEKNMLAGTINTYKNLQMKGQIEISTSPMMHPIMPLLFTTDTAKKTKTSLSTPEGIFSYPEDAREHLSKGIKTYEDLFGKRPAGIWPSEGSLSTEVLDMLSENGLLWTATDEYLLAETLARPLSSNEHYCIWDYKNKISIFFRDHHISDLIGFTYQQMAENDSALRFTDALRSIASKNSNGVVTIILDGENPWDFYPDYGRTFLPTIYRILSESSDFKTVTFTEALDMDINRQKMDTISPGSWMGTNFDNWIGKEPANKAWTILSQARKKAEEKKSSLNAEQQKKVIESIMLAESSDWFWWYSLQADRSIKMRFDAYFRSIIREIYEEIGETVPEFLNLPVEEYTYEEVIPYISPTIDGKITHFYEWHDAVKVDPFSLWATFKPVGIPIKTLFYGYDEENLYVRIDPDRKKGFDIHLLFHNSGDKKFTIIYEKEVNEPLTVTSGEIIEIMVPRNAILPEGEKTILFRIGLTEKNGQEVILPAGEYFRVNFAGKEENWIV